jgi:hypothetical protein
MFKFVLALLGLCVVYWVCRKTEDPIAQAIKANNRERDRLYPLGPDRDEFAGWEKEVQRIIHDGQT